MNWKKAKTFLILVFLAVNIFLIFYLERNTKTAELDNSSFLAVLENNNIIYSSENTSGFPQKIQKAELFNSSDEDFIQKFLGKNFSSDKENVFSSEKGTLIFGEDISFISKKNKKISKLDEETAAKEALSYLTDKNLYTKKAEFVPVEIKADKGIYKVKFKTGISGYEVFNANVIVEISDIGVSKVSGYFIKEKESENTVDDILSEKEVILELIANEELKKINSPEITAVSFGFIKSNQGEIIPAYKITVSETDFYCDARYNIKRSERILKL